MTQTELMRESFRHNQEIGELLEKQEELQERLSEEAGAREQLAVELQRAEGRSAAVLCRLPETFVSLRSSKVVRFSQQPPGWNTCCQVSKRCFSIRIRSVLQTESRLGSSSITWL